MKTVILNETDQSLQIVLGGAVTTNQVRFVAQYVDVDTTASPRTYTPDNTHGTSNDTTDVDAVAAPASNHYREVYELTVYNQDTVTVNLTVKLDDGGTERIFFKGNLAVGGTWNLSTFDAAGSLALALDDLTDVGISGAAAGQVLAHNGSGWVNAYGGKLIQEVGAQDGAVATGTTVIPYDDTIPQNTEGDQYLSQTITPKMSTSTLYNEVSIFASSSVLSYIIAALFQDTTVGALAVGAERGDVGTGIYNVKFTHKMTSGTTSATTFKVRIGGSSAGTITFNGESGARKFGGVFSSSLIIREVAP